jgi:RHS repeat-associated protein
MPYEAAPNGSLQRRLLSQSRTLYFDQALAGPLPLGQLESLALPFQSYAKAFTPALVADVFTGRATDAILVEGGYVKLDGDDAWWIPSGRQIFAPDQFYLPVAFLGPFGNPTTIAYDHHRLAVVQAADPVGNITAASHDYRVLSPAEVIDPNGNRAQARFDPLGLVVATAVMGKPGSTDGDTLADPTTTFDYDLSRFRSTGKPAVAHARAREQHGAANTRWQESYSYSDGSGREVMKKVQAEPDDTGAPRWVGTGRTVLDNKGHPVKQYEPYFSATAEYEDEPEIVEQGVTPVLRYDPLGRLVRTDLPDGTFSTVVFDPWSETRSDANDTVLDSAWYRERQAAGTPPEEPRAARLAAAHANTPTVVHLDALGRTFLTVEDNGPAGKYETRVALDIEGNPFTITDARGVVAIRHRFAMGGHKLWQKSCDAGERWTLADASGAMLRAWDSRGFTRRALYDRARRQTHLYVTPADGAEMLVERIVYGETLGDAATLSNHRGRIHRYYDGAGVVTSVGYDFKGNLLRSERRLAKDYRSQPNWRAVYAPEAPASAADAQLESESFVASTAWDALNRPISQVTPDQSETRPMYNEAGLLEKIQARLRGAAEWTTFVDGIDYDAKGRRTRIVYGGNPGKRTTTIYAYDPRTFHLAHLSTTRERDGARLQDLRYTYDPVGNITAIRDDAQQTIFFDNAVVTPSTTYVYDALYRLIQATGREQPGGLADQQRDDRDLPLANLPHANDKQALHNYTETYRYDAVGNFLSMTHDSGVSATNWTRRYQTDLTSNRLLGTSLPGDDGSTYSAKYTHDAHGNMISMPHLARIDWDWKDRMQHADKGGGSAVYFTYDAAGARIRKVWEHGGTVDERIYLGGHEIYRRRRSGALVLERETLHIMNGVNRVAMIETRTVDTSVAALTPTPVTRFQLPDHLGSVAIEIDLHGRLISHEEYYPYGTSAYCAGAEAVEVSRKRYRYTAKERDEETSLYCSGARYRAPWLGIWISADPAGLVDGPNLYRYVQNSPVTFHDPSGTKTTYLGSSKEEGYVARLENVWEGRQYWDDKGQSGAGWYVRTSGNTILPRPTRELRLSDSGITSADFSYPETYPPREVKMRPDPATMASKERLWISKTEFNMFLADSDVQVQLGSKEGLKDVAEFVEKYGATHKDRPVLYIEGHGKAGVMEIGKDQISRDSLTQDDSAPVDRFDPRQVEALKRIGQSISKIELSGCEVGDDTKGVALLKRVADITEVPVAAPEQFQIAGAGRLKGNLVMVDPGGKVTKQSNSSEAWELRIEVAEYKTVAFMSKIVNFWSDALK